MWFGFSSSLFASRLSAYNKFRMCTAWTIRHIGCMNMIQPICNMFFFLLVFLLCLERSTLIAFHFNPSSGGLLVDLNQKHIHTRCIEHAHYIRTRMYACIDSISFAYFVTAAAVVNVSKFHGSISCKWGGLKNYFSLTLFISGLDIR